MSVGIGRVWFAVTWHRGRRWCDLHGARGGGGASFTLDLWAFGLQGGIEAAS